MYTGDDESSHTTAGAGIELRPRPATLTFTDLVHVPANSCRARVRSGSHTLVCVRASNCRSSVGGSGHTALRAEGRADEGWYIAATYPNADGVIEIVYGTAVEPGVVNQLRTFHEELTRCHGQAGRLQCAVSVLFAVTSTQ